MIFAYALTNIVRIGGLTSLAILTCSDYFKDITYHYLWLKNHGQIFCDSRDIVEISGETRYTNAVERGSKLTFEKNMMKVYQK
jgi:hypothetical protein